MKTAATGGVLSVCGLGLALREVRRSLSPARVPLLGLATAFVFAAQMLNFPVAGGTSGHLLGAVLVAVLLGPAAAVVVMSAVVILQCLMFADGGLTALGVNLFNMALVAPLVGYGVYAGIRWVAGEGLRSRLCGALFGAWCATVVAAIACAGQLAFADTAPWATVFPAMTLVHMLIGVGEAIITGFALAGIARVRPELFGGSSQDLALGGLRRVVWPGLLMAVGLAVFVAPFASPWPDGLEKVAVALGFEHRATEVPVLPAPLPDYEVPGVESAGWATAVAGLVGTLLAFGLAWGLAYGLTRQTRGAV